MNVNKYIGRWENEKLVWKLNQVLGDVERTQISSTVYSTFIPQDPTDPEESLIETMFCFFNNFS